MGKVGDAYDRRLSRRLVFMTVEILVSGLCRYWEESLGHHNEWHSCKARQEGFGAGSSV